MENLSPFEGCWARYRRAELHREVIHEFWSGLIEHDLYENRVEIDDAGSGRLAVYPTFAMPEHFALELGELLYNLRAALDGAIYVAAMLDSGQDPPPNESSLEFVVRATPRKFADAVGKLGPIRPERRAFIEDVQVYGTTEQGPGADRARRSLVVLNDWARIDRHRRLHLVASLANLHPAEVRVWVPDGPEAVNLKVLEYVVLEHDSELATFHMPGWVPGMDVQVNAEVHVEIGVAEDPLPAGPDESFSRRTEDMLNTVENIVSYLERSFGFCDPTARVPGHSPPRLEGWWTEHIGRAPS